MTDLERRPLALLVDRDLDTRQMYAEFLRIKHCDVHEAEDGREALAKVFSIRPDVIVTESRLPGMSGFDLCRLLRQDHQTANIPILFVTGDAFPAEIQRAVDAGATEVLVKPCLPEQVATAIHRHLQRSGVTHAAADLARSNGSIERPRLLNRSYVRHDTTERPTPSLVLFCPTCDRPLKYLKTHMGGVNAKRPERWDYFECESRCGMFQFRQRTRKLRRVL
jgi:CheY-like chemotaxis protein